MLITRVVGKRKKLNNENDALQDKYDECQYVGPKFEVLRDPSFEAAVASGTLQNDLYHRYIPGTIHLMNSTAMKTHNRYPLAMELEEMAKTLVIKYLVLKDDVTNHVSYIIDGPIFVSSHNILFFSIESIIIPLELSSIFFLPNFYFS